VNLNRKRFRVNSIFSNLNSAQPHSHHFADTTLHAFIPFPFVLKPFFREIEPIYMASPSYYQFLLAIDLRWPGLLRNAFGKSWNTKSSALWIIKLSEM